MFSVTITSNRAGLRHEPHRARVDELVLERDVGELLGRTCVATRAPQPRRLEHVRLVDRRQLAAPAARELDRQAHDARDLLGVVRAQVARALAAARQLLEALLAEVEPPVSSRTTSRSTPFEPLRPSGEASTSAGCGATGRRLAYRPSALRIASSPCSGRTFAVGLSHFGPPTAPSSTASARLAHRERRRRAARCRSRRSPRRRSAPSSNANSMPASSAAASSTRRACGDDLRADAVARQEGDGVRSSARRSCGPRGQRAERRAVRRLVLRRVVRGAEQEAQLVDAVQQAVASRTASIGERHRRRRRAASTCDVSRSTCTFAAGVCAAISFASTRATPGSAAGRS